MGRGKNDWLIVVLIVAVLFAVFQGGSFIFGTPVLTATMNLPDALYVTQSSSADVTAQNTNSQSITVQPLSTELNGLKIKVDVTAGEIAANSPIPLKISIVAAKEGAAVGLTIPLTYTTKDGKTGKLEIKTNGQTNIMAPRIKVTDISRPFLSFGCIKGDEPSSITVKFRNDESTSFDGISIIVSTDSPGVSFSSTNEYKWEPRSDGKSWKVNIGHIQPTATELTAPAMLTIGLSGDSRRDIKLYAQTQIENNGVSSSLGDLVKSDICAGK